MIHAAIFHDGKGRLTGFSVKGHAGYAEEGSDIVCAAVSALTITCVNSLEAVCGITPTVEGGEDGYLKAMLPCPLAENAAHDAQVLLRALETGLQSMTEAYSPYIKLSIQERRETQ